jgi:hypothetical protein
LPYQELAEASPKDEGYSQIPMQIIQGYLLDTSEIEMTGVATMIDELGGFLD